jgi:hypothetical protein
MRPLCSACFRVWIYSVRSWSCYKKAGEVYTFSVVYSSGLHRFYKTKNYLSAYPIGFDADLLQIHIYWCKANRTTVRPQFNGPWLRRHSFQLQMLWSANAARNILVAKHCSQKKEHTTSNLSSQHVTIGQCSFEADNYGITVGRCSFQADRAEIWYKGSINSSWTVVDIRNGFC